MNTQNKKPIIGKAEVYAILRVIALAALFTIPFVMNHSAKAEHGATAGSGAGFVLFVSIMRPR